MRMIATAKTAGRRMTLATKSPGFDRGYLCTIYQVLERLADRRRRRDEHSIDALRERSSDRPDRFPDPALGAVALDRASYGPAGGNAHPGRPLFTCVERVHHNDARGRATPGGVRSSEISG